MSDTLNSAEPARRRMRRGTAAAETAATDLEALTGTASYKRRQKAEPDAISQNLTAH